MYILLYDFTMNKQLVFGVIAVVFATALIASLVVDQANAQRSNRQSISQHNINIKAHQL